MRPEARERLSNGRKRPDEELLELLAMSRLLQDPLDGLRETLAPLSDVDPAEARASAAKAAREEAIEDIP